MTVTPDFTRIARSLDLADPDQGHATTPDVVDAVWWLTLKPLQACAELGISAEVYPRVHRDVSAVVTAYENRKSQGQLDPNEGAPIIRRKRTRHLAPLFQGGTVKRIGPRSPLGSRG
jgi:hypothetical protein